MHDKSRTLTSTDYGVDWQNVYVCGRHGYDHMVNGFLTTYAISAYHH